MAKIYDALRRAEESRRERAGQSTPEVAAPLAWEPPARGREERRRTSLWERLRGLAPGGRRAAADSATDINKRRIALLQPDSYVAEQFRTLRARIDAVAAERPVRTLAVTSALAGEGKSTAAINLAVVSAMQLETRVCLVDCDLRKPKIHRSLGIQPKAGLAEVLEGETALDEALVAVEGLSLQVLGVRKQPPNPAELLSGPGMRQLVRELAERFDRVVLDTPATLSLPDAKIVSALCDGLVMVVRADVTPSEDLEAALDLLDRQRVLGLVLNGAQVDQGRYSYYPY